jgi:hypothetical protein
MYFDQDVGYLLRNKNMSSSATVDRAAAIPAHPGNVSVFNRPHVQFGREICGDLESGLRREWLVTNGIGGYASATLPGVLTRSYHGLLVAALEPPVARTVLVAGSSDWIGYDGKRYPLSTHEFGAGSVSPDGYPSSNRSGWKECCPSGHSPSRML